jgi:hypothetical protein
MAARFDALALLALVSITGIVAPTAAAEPAPYAPWTGTAYPPPPPVATDPPTALGPEPREWARRAGELGLRALFTAPFPVDPAAPTGSRSRPALGTEVVALARMSPWFGAGLAAALSSPLAGSAGAAPAARVSGLLRTAARDRGAFDPYAELAFGVVRQPAGAPAGDEGADWAAQTRVLVGPGWYVSRSLRLGAVLGAEVSRPGAVSGAPSSGRGSAQRRWVSGTTFGLEVAVCLGDAY